MYSLKEKEGVIQEIKDGKSIDEIHNKYNISKSTLFEWKKEVKIRREIKELVGNEQFEEAKKLAERLTSKTSQMIKLSILIRYCNKRRKQKRKKRRKKRREKKIIKYAIRNRTTKCNSNI